MQCLILTWATAKACLTWWPHCSAKSRMKVIPSGALLASWRTPSSSARRVMKTWRGSWYHDLFTVSSNVSGQRQGARRIAFVCTLYACRCTYVSCCASCCRAFTCTWPGWGRTAYSCSSAIAGYCSASSESSPTQKLCACGRPAGHTTRSVQSLNGTFAYARLWEKTLHITTQGVFGSVLFHCTA